ncbi:4-hydroxy-tetrahydrodipicolinate reductase [Frateuria sp. STR12]|uniref:4-hydroxy-tetrahydrodipicolinate reductase n=1 Tax=Frateuria hangzhouensis TaxID=2995589 RepID=UPI002260F814|nr:4-hydroxy-tetrahydrodipicolinate reductase [Frateuria sp. STR12]MCX7512417.1 4-hydroxy-tetrahydrodipicolinate reductase [Frateuria sp. STR12]
MTRPLRLAVNGATGRMGRVLLDLLREDARFELVAALTAPGSSQLGERAWHDSATPHLGADWPQEPLDVVIDFSGPAGLASALDYCTGHGVALVSGTTGVDASLEARAAEAASRIPLMHASNFSLGVALLTQLLRQAAAALPDWDLEIVEAHHSRKVDAPSGTALSLGQAAASARGTTLARDGVGGAREGARRSGSIGFAVVRGGDIVGEHAALLIGAGERVELGHRATDRSIFARGAIEAAHWLRDQPPGAYDLQSMLASRVA